MKTIQKVIIEYGVNRFAEDLTPDEADQLHKRYFGIKPVNIGMIRSTHKYIKAIVSAILKDQPYNERKMFHDIGYSDEMIDNIDF